MKKYYCDVCGKEDKGLVELALHYVSLSRTMNTKLEPLKEGDTPVGSIQTRHWEICHDCSDEMNADLTAKALNRIEKEKS